jgi:hypothetical protein
MWTHLLAWVFISICLLRSTFAVEEKPSKSDEECNLHRDQKTVYVGSPFDRAYEKRCHGSAIRDLATMNHDDDLDRRCYNTCRKRIGMWDLNDGHLYEERSKYRIKCQYECYMLYSCTPF